MKHFLLFILLLSVNLLVAQTFNKVTYNSSNSGLPHNHIRCISIDSNDHVWVGTQQGGMARFDGANWSVWNTNNSNMPGNNVVRVQPLENGEVWLSTYTGSVFAPYTISKWSDNNLTNWTGINNEFAVFEAFDFYNNKVWVSTSIGLYTYEDEGFTKFNTIDQCIPQTTVSDVLFVSPDKYWIALSDYTFNGAETAGLIRVNQNNCSIYHNKNSGFPSNNATRNLKRDRDNPDKVWMSTNAGVVSFDGTTWKILNAPGTSLPRGYVFDSYGVIWSAYNIHGLQRYDGAWKSYSSLVGDEINDLAIDSHNNLWIATQSSGLIKLERAIASNTNNPEAQTIKCYPTILGQELFIDQDQDKSSTWQLMEINGRIIAQEKFAGLKSTISLTKYNIPSGIYFFCIKNENNDIIKTGKLIKS